MKSRGINTIVENTYIVRFKNSCWNDAERKKYHYFSTKKAFLEFEKDRNYGLIIRTSYCGNYVLIHHDI